MEEPEEFDRLLDIYNRYPFEELILHPRVQKDYYKISRGWNILKRHWKKHKSRMLQRRSLYNC